MPASRFARVSIWRNAVLEVSPSGSRFEELSLAAPSDTGRLLGVSHDFVLSRSSTASSSLLVIPHGAPGKYAKQPPAYAAASASNITDFDVSPFDDALVVAGTDAGTLSLSRLPPHSHSDTFPPTLSASPEIVFNTTVSRPIHSVQLHPTSTGLFLGAAGNIVEIFDGASGKAESAMKLETQDPIWSTSWSRDGRSIALTSKGQCQVFDPRHSQTAIESFACHASKVKPTCVTYVRSSHLLTTGFSAMREREWALWDPRSTARPIHRVALDNSVAILTPQVDHDRGMVFMSSRGDSSVRWVDALDSSFASGAFPVPFPLAAVALGPSSVNNVMTGEIDRLYIASTSNSIAPASVIIPRRQYIDFHADLYPDTTDTAAAQQGSEWLKGSDVQVALVSQDPAKQRARTSVPAVPAPTASTVVATPVQASAPSAQPAVTATPPAAAQEKDTTTPSTSQAPKVQIAAASVATPAVSAPIDSAPSASTPPSKSARPAPAQAPAPAPPLPAPTRAKAASTSTAPVPRWSRRFLAGVTPLVPAFQSLNSLDVSQAPSARLLGVSSTHFFVALSGPGGRLGFHPLSQTGRLPTQLSYFSAPAKLVDFSPDPFEADKVVTVADDGAVRVWRVPEAASGGEKQADPAPVVADTSLRTFEAHGSSKVIEIHPSPVAKGLYASASAEDGSPVLLWDLESERGGVVRELQVGGGGAHGLEWSPDGKLIAVASKDRKVRIVDPRKGPAGETIASAATHDSSRPFKLCWLSDTHLVSAGHGAASMRELRIFELTSTGTLELLRKTVLDVSPALLFPHWDAMTSILYLHSKGERSVSAFEVQVGELSSVAAGKTAPPPTGASRFAAKPADPVQALPAFTHATPQLGLAFPPDRRALDVRNTETARSLRLARTELQLVGWKIERSRPEFFQDDIYVPMPASHEPLLSATDWLAGATGATPTLLNLCPPGTTPLSLAPAPTARARALPPAAKVRSEAEREEELLAGVFRQAKDAGADEEDVRGGKYGAEAARRAPDDGDWSD